MSRLSTIEKIILFLIIIIIAIGYLFYFSDIKKFEWYVKEDNLAEWLTVGGLLLSSAVCFSRFVRLFKFRNWWFLTVTFVLGILLFIAAGEEISWGQRILGIESSEYFQKNNAQGETNLHNLVVNGVKINKLIFSTLLSIVLAIYLILLPIVYYRHTGFKNFVDRSGVAVPRLYQIIGFVLIFAITALLKHEKNPELLECGAALMFFLVVTYPRNKTALSERAFIPPPHHKKDLQ